MFNNNYYQQQQQPMTQYQFNAVKEPAMTQPLTNEQMNELRNTGKFDLAVSPTDLMKAKCTHKQNGKIVLQATVEGKLYCPICRETFSEQEISDIQVSECVDAITDILQTIKTYYVDMPMDVANNFFQFIPLLRKIPHMYKLSIDNFKSHENANLLNATQMNQGLGFNAYNSLITPSSYPMMYGQAGMQQPMYGQPGMMPQPGMPPMQQPMYDNNGQQNPFGSYAQQGIQQPMYQPAPQGYAQPGMMAPPMQPMYGQPAPQGYAQQAAPAPVQQQAAPAPVAGNVQVEKVLNS